MSVLLLVLCRPHLLNPTIQNISHSHCPILTLTLLFTCVSLKLACRMSLFLFAAVIRRETVVRLDDDRSLQPNKA